MIESRNKVLEMNHGAALAKPETGFENKQSRRLLIALTLLLFALAVVLIKDRDFWFGSEQAQESDAVSTENVSKTASSVAPKTGPAAATPVARKQTAHKAAAQPPVTEPSHTDAVNPDSPAVATKRTVLPPLEVEVIAGDSHRTVRPGSNATKVELATVSTNAAEHERLSNASLPELRQTIDSSYPLLGQNTKVQGSVVLQAVVGADGIIEDLRVLSGPAILSAAAQQAVRQWRFKPYLQNGQPVETKARITVNFSIHIGDNPAKSS